MHPRKLLLVIACAALSLATASAASKYNVTFDRPAVIGGVELAPGQYRLTIEGDKAMIESGKQTTEVNVTIHTESSKFSSTAVRYDIEGAKSNVVQIRLGGTNQVVEFNGQAAVKSGGGGPNRNAVK